MASPIDAPVGPRPHGRKRWAEIQRERRQVRFHQLLQRSFGFRLLLAAGAAVLLLAVVNRWENCRSNRFAAGCLVADAGGIVSVGNVESLSIVTAAFLFVLEAGKRRQRDNIEALEVILTCQQAGAKMSFARNSALEMLTASGLWLDGLDLSHAQLDELDAAHGHWRDVNLHRASLRGANLQDAHLAGSDLSDADLSHANCSHADLRKANLRGANLSHTDLRGADLRGAITDGVELTGTQLEGAALEGTSLSTAMQDA
jgi:hypothetical protein